MACKSAYVDTQNFGLDDLFFVDELTMKKHFPLHRYPDGAIMGIRRSQNTEPAGISQWLWTGIQRYQLLHRRAVPSDDFIDMEMWKILTSRLSMEISAASLPCCFRPAPMTCCSATH